MPTHVPARDVAPPRDRIYPPTVGPRAWVWRHGLLETLRRAATEADQRVVMITGPAGAGKSVLARQVLETDDREHLEISVVARLDEAAALSRTVVRALETVGPLAPNLHSSITSDEPGFSTIVLPALARLVVSRTQDYVLVVDDLHLLRSRGCQDVLLTVCQATPAGSQVVLLSRDETPAWLARTRAEGRLLEVGGDDLRFDVGEAAELFRRMQVPIDRLDVGSVVDRTEGWAVALYLSGLATRHHYQSRSLVTEGDRDSTRFISDYISAEVLRPLDSDLQSFLIRTSILDELSTGLCNAILERDDSVALLARLQTQLQLVIPLDPLGRRLRYHHLLSDALRSELAHRTPGEVPLLHARASRWFADVGDLDSAIRHAKAAQDLVQVGQLVWSRTAHCVGSGEKDRLAFWLHDLSEEQIAHDRWLCLAAAWLTLQSGETDHMDRWIVRAETHAGTDWKRRTDQDRYAAELAVIVGLVGRTGLEETQHLCDAAARALPPDAGFRPAALFIQGVALTLNHKVEQGLRCLADAGRLGRVLDIPILEADALSWQGILAMAEGDHARGQRLITSAHDVIRDNRLERLATAAHSITAQSLVQALRHDPEAATTLATARRLTSQVGDVAPWFAVCGRLIQARAAVALGEGALARQLITEARARMTPDLQDSLARDLLEDADASLKLLKTDGAVLPALTATEMRVLQFLPSHLAHREIGEHLFISPNTVKSHVKAIHQKLGVSSRAQAVERAQELGLLEAPAYD